MSPLEESRFSSPLDRFTALHQNNSAPAFHPGLLQSFPVPVAFLHVIRMLGNSPFLDLNYEFLLESRSIGY